MSQSDAVRLEIDELDALRAEIERQAAAAAPRWNADPEEVQKSVARLILALVEFLRKLMEKQAIRRMEGGSLSDEEIERLGTALMRQAEEIERLRLEFGLTEEDLNLDLGPLGKLL